MRKKSNFEEEKKEGTWNKSATDSDSDEELEEFSPEILEVLGDRRYESEEELRKALAEAGVSDLRVVLVDGKPYKIIPGHQHNKFTTKYVNEFGDWRKNYWGKWGTCSGTHKIHLSNGNSRDPDLSFWGYPRCNPECTEPLIEDAIPDVVIQFSWKNKMWYEEKALNDMMTKGLEQEEGTLSTTRPRVGYMIKVRFSKKRVLAGAIKGDKTQDMLGLDIYRLSHGTTLADARDPTNNDAEFMQYAPGGQEILIVIKPEDLGVTGFSALLCGSYRLKASDIFGQMEVYHKNRQARGLAT